MRTESWSAGAWRQACGSVQGQTSSRLFCSSKRRNARTAQTLPGISSSLYAWMSMACETYPADTLSSISAWMTTADFCASASGLGMLLAVSAKTSARLPTRPRGGQGHRPCAGALWNLSLEGP